MDHKTAGAIQQKMLQLIQYGLQAQLCSQSVYSRGEAIRGVAYTIAGRFVPVVNVNAPVATGHMERCGLTHRRTGCLGDKRKLTTLAALKSNKCLSL